MAKNNGVPVLSGIVASETSRYSITGIRLGADSEGRVWAAATNGRVGAIVRVPDDVEVCGLNGHNVVVPRASWSAIEKAPAKTASKLDIVERDRGEGDVTATTYKRNAAVTVRDALLPDRFPDLEAVMPSSSAPSVGPKGGTVRVSLNAELLVALQRALGASSHDVDGITLDIPVDRKGVCDAPIRVTPIHASLAGNVGVIMPMSST